MLIQNTKFDKSLRNLPDQSKIVKFRKGLADWRRIHGLRLYPWRETKNKYKMLLTEILLRRTRSESVNSIWDHFFIEYPDISSIKKTSNKDLKEVLHPLGLSNLRAKQLKNMCDKIGKRIPQDEDILLELPGIGKYIARMYLLMIYNKRGLIYDTNFRRVYSRFFGLEIMTDLKRDPIIDPLSELVIPKRGVKNFVLILLDFAALTCKPQKPICENCCMTETCEFYAVKSPE